MNDQTEKEWLEARTTPSDLGTGVFLSADEDPPKLFVEGITYEDCVQRAGKATAFKWVPEFVSTYEEVVGSGCSPYREEKKSA